MNLVVFVIVPFAILYLYGLKLPDLSSRRVGELAVGSGLIFLAIAIFHALAQRDFVHTQAYKYPPTIYYLSYAFCALNVVYLVCRNYLSRFPSSALSWLSANSLWVYLWHILAVYLWRFTFGSADGYLPLVAAKAAFLLGFGVCATLLQNAVSDCLRRRDFRRDLAEGASPINQIS